MLNVCENAKYSFDILYKKKIKYSYSFCFNLILFTIIINQHVFFHVFRCHFCMPVCQNVFVHTEIPFDRSYVYNKIRRV